VRERPAEVADTDLLAEVRRAWDPEVVRVEHLPVGFGAHHWAAYDDDAARLFVTFDRLGGRHTAATLEAAYAGAVALREAGLDEALTPVRLATGSCTAAFAGGALSCSPWRDGRSGGELDVAWTRRTLARLHAMAPPAGIRRWAPLVGPDLADTIATLTRRPWGPGPYADRARAAVTEHLSELATWTARYHHLGDIARDRDWVAAHGEPHSSNQLVTDDGRRLLIDWDTLTLAPAELDLRTLIEAGLVPHDIGADTEMLELFDLEWRLDELHQYSVWFAAPHAGTADDEIAFGGMLHELERPGQAATSSG
jgi:spectinomycin phosphotransferase